MTFIKRETAERHNCKKLSGRRLMDKGILIVGESRDADNCD